jgi:beta-glucanase (GH16 family)
MLIRITKFLFAICAVVNAFMPRCERSMSGKGSSSRSLRAARAVRILTAGALQVVLALILPASSSAAWQLSWSDEFNQADGSSPNSANWGFDTGGSGWGNNELEYYTSRTNNARIQGGQLVIEAKRENFGGRSYTSARLLTKGKRAWTYGRVEAKIKIPRGQGIWPAFWMLGTNIDSVNWPGCGEIDIMENIGKTNDQNTVHGTIHGPQPRGDYNGGSGIGGSYTLYDGSALADDFHVYAVEWTTNKIKWYLDDIAYFVATPANLPAGGTWVFTQPQFLLLNVAVGGNWPGNPDATSVFPQQMLVDYVRVYSYVPSPPDAPTYLYANPGDGKVSLGWAAPESGADGYLIKRASTSGGPYLTIGTSPTSNFSDAGVSNAATYYYVVSATNSIGESTNSTEQVAALSAFTQEVNSGNGAVIPWSTYEAEDMTTSGYVFGPSYHPGAFGVEASGRSFVYLDTAHQYLEFKVKSAANRMIVRYCVPDAASGGGTNYTLSLYTNGVFARKLNLTSQYTWLYGQYPFSNSPSSGAGRNLFDELRLTNISFTPGENVRLQKDGDDSASFYGVDLVDLENDLSTITQPANSLSVASYGADASGASDSTTALVNCISAANTQSKSVWVPAGTYNITNSINLPTGTTIQGAGIWNTTFVGDPALYGNSSRRVTFNGNGSKIHLADFAIVGRLTYRNDSEPNDGVGGSYGTGSTISRIWVEHTKTGAWIVNSSGLIIDGCRFRDTIADGVNLCVGMTNCMVTNCTARGTGDDCFAMWPATYIAQTYTPGLNLVTRCTAQLPFLANGCAIYGGTGNSVDNCLIQDICYAPGVLISTTFPVGGNVFRGITSVHDCDLNRCGGSDPNGGWIGAFLLYLDDSSLSGINVSNVNIRNSLADGFDVVAPGSSTSSGLGTLSNAIISQITVTNYGLGSYYSDALWADSSAIGSLTVRNCDLAEYSNYSINFIFNFVSDSLRASLELPAINYDGSVFITSTVTVGFPYHLERTTNISTPMWQTVPDSQLTAMRSTIYQYDTDTNQVPSRFYRLVSP